MTFSDSRRITDELLSAYIDGEVTEQERAFIEAAVAQDEEIAWRLHTLRQTVTLLRDLPELALPRSFTLTLDQVRLPASDEELANAGMAERVPAAPHMQRKAAPTTQAGFWEQINEGWRRFWQAGNPVLRNAAAVSFALMLLLVGGGQIINRAIQPAQMLASVPDAAPASAGAAPAESVALAPTATEEGAALQAQDEATTNNAPVEEDAALMQAPAASPAQSTESAAAEGATESAAAGSAPAVQGNEDAAAGEAEAASVMAAPDQGAQAAQAEAMPPLEPSPIPGGIARSQSGGAGSAGDMGGAEAPIAPGMGGGGETGGLVPEEAHAFVVDPDGPPQAPSAEEAVSASIAAAPAAEAPAGSAADVVGTPAVDAPAEAASAAVADEDTGEAAGEDAAARSAAPAEEPAADAEQAEAEQAQVGEAQVEQFEAEPTATPAVEPTPAEVAAVAPGTITSSEVIENVQTGEAVTMTNVGFNLPVLWIAQGTALLLTVVLASLWWRSRTPRL